jgi:hypothetical protein
MNIKTKKKRLDAKPKRFSWNLELNLKNYKLRKFILISCDKKLL